MGNPLNYATPEALRLFGRFSDDIRGAMKLANREAIRHRYPFIDTPHLLIATVREETGLAGILLRQHGLVAKELRRAIHREIPAERAFRLYGKLPLGPRVEHVVQRAVDHAQSNRHDSVGTGGILLALLRHDCTTREILQRFNLEAREIEPKLAFLLHRFMVEAPGQVLQIDWAIVDSGYRACSRSLGPAINTDHE